MSLKSITRFLLSVAMMGSGAAQQSTAPAQPSGDFQISGTLVDSLTSQPVARARVGIAPVTKRNDFTTVITGEDGVFSFAKLTPGKYVLTAQARGYLLQSFDQHDTFATSIVTGADFDTSHLVFRLPPAGSIAGAVTDEAGEPVRNAQVALYFTGLAAGSEATRLRGRMMTDDQGAFRFAHLGPGHYLLAVNARPWYAQHPRNLPGVKSDPGASVLDVAYPITFYSSAVDPAMAAPVVLATGDRATANVTVQPVRALRIRVTPDSGAFGRETRLVLERSVLDGPSSYVGAEIRSDERGIQEFVGLAPGRYTVTTYTAGGNIPSEPVSSREIEVSANGQTQWTTYVPLTAKLQFDSGARPSQAYLQLLNTKTRVVNSQRVSDAGDALFKQGVAPGSYEVSITNAPGFYLKSISSGGAGVTGRTIEVRSGAPVNLTISATHGQGQITGVASRQNKSFAGAMIVLVPADPAHNQVLFRRDQTDSDGSFSVPDVVPGAYTLLALEHGWEMAWMDPEVLKNYLARGAAVQVQPNGKYELKVDVQ